MPSPLSSGLAGASPVRGSRGGEPPFLREPGARRPDRDAARGRHRAWPGCCWPVSHSSIAGRMAGALRAVGRPDDADSIWSAMRAAGHRDAREKQSLRAGDPGLRVAAERVAARAAHPGDVGSDAAGRDRGLPRRSPAGREGRARRSCRTSRRATRLTPTTRCRSRASR